MGGDYKFTNLPNSHNLISLGEGGGTWGWGSLFVTTCDPGRGGGQICVMLFMD